MHGILESTLQDLRRGKCVLLELFEHASPEEREHESAPALFYFARRHEKRAVFIFQFSSTKLLFGDQIEQTFAGSRLERRDSRRKFRRIVSGGGGEEGQHILNQLDHEVENRLADSHRRFPSSLIPDRYESTFRLHGFCNRNCEEKVAGGGEGLVTHLAL